MGRRRRCGKASSIDISPKTVVSTGHSRRPSHANERTPGMKA